MAYQTRYTHKFLKEELKTINQAAKTVRGSNTHLKAQGRNGYTGLDEFDDATGICLRNITCGTPRECYIAALEWSMP